MNLLGWLHRRLDASFETKIKVDILAELFKFQKPEELFMNHAPVLCDRLPNYEKSKVLIAIGELKSCGYVGGSDTIKSQRYITGEGKELLKQYNQFLHKGLLSKLTWWFKNHLEGLWRIIWMIFFPVSVVLTVATKFDVIRKLVAKIVIEK